MTTVKRENLFLQINDQVTRAERYGIDNVLLSTEDEGHLCGKKINDTASKKNGWQARPFF